MTNPTQNDLPASEPEKAARLQRDPKTGTPIYHVLSITRIDLETKTEVDIIQITLPEGVDPYKATPLIMDALAGVRPRKQRSDKGTTKGGAQ